MNDRFKFRVWNKETNLMLTDITGWVIDEKKEKFRYFRNNSALPDGMGTWLMPLDNVIIEQCTGMRDRNGKLIYEGDIVQFYHARKRNIDQPHVVFYRDCNFALGLPDDRLTNFWLGSKELKGIEIIGNIYENPELLK